MLIYDIYNKESFESIVEVFKLIENNWKNLSYDIIRK